MKNRIQLKDLRIISYYTGAITMGTAALMVIPLIIAILFVEWPSFIDFLISIGISLDIGIILMIFGRKELKRTRVQWKHGLVISSLSWIILMILCAIPYILSGNSLSMLDACFDVMSGFTTTGVLLLQDLDHISMSFNMWRHILTFIGGQGMVVLALSLLVKDTVGAYKMYVGEGKDVELVPNVKGTAKIIWMISMIYLAVGTVALWINGMLIGLSPVTAFFHGMFIFMSSWSTGGFAPMSQNMMYYHSFSYEVLSIIFFIIGSFNFGLHYSVWKGDKKEIFKNIETKSFFITATLTSALVILILDKLNIYKDAMGMFRRGVYNLLSAHTTTGFGNVYARQFALEWGDFGILIMVIAMLIGGSACSTAGGFKGLRVGVVFKGIVNEIKKLLSSERRVTVYKFHHLKDTVLDDAIIKSSAIIIICYIVLFTVGTALGAYYGYPLSHSAFEAASISGNVGLSIGITTATMPSGLKIYYILAMYLGRLEFLSVFALIGFVFGGIKKVCVGLVRQ